MQESQGSCYSSDEQYFLDLCRAGQLQQLHQFIAQLNEPATFDWTCITYTHDNFLHMLASNNLTTVFDYLFPFVKEKIGKKIEDVIHKQNSTGNTPLHYAVITNSQQMVVKLLGVGANPNIVNQSNRTPFDQAQNFGKSQIAEILAPITKNNLEELKKEVELLDVCNQDSSESDEEEGQLSKKQGSNPPKKQEQSKE